MSRKNAKVTLSMEKVLSVLQKKAGFTVPEVIKRLRVPEYRDLEVRKVLHQLVQSGKAIGAVRVVKNFIGRPPMTYKAR